MAEPAQTPGFPGVVGHEGPTGMLARALGRDRLHHSILLSGPRGVGKTTLATGLACAALCEVSPGLGCGNCPTCQRVLTGRHTDLRHLEGTGMSGSIKVEHAREVIVRTQHAPFEANRHFLLVHEADRFNASSGNALLKLFEEPPPGVHFVMLTANPAELLDTLVSRSVHLRLSPLTDAQVGEVVAQHPEATKQAPPERVETAIRLAQGSPGLALELLADAESLEPIRRFLAEMIAAAREGPPRIFGGERSPLWQAFEAAWSSIADPEAEEDDAPEPEVVVVKQDGRKKKPAKKKRKKSKLTEARARKIKPYQQRTATRRMADLWAIHLREQLRGAEGLPGVPASSRAGAALVGELDRVRQLRDALGGNPNVRLALEQTLLDLSA